MIDKDQFVHFSWGLLVTLTYSDHKCRGSLRGKIHGTPWAEMCDCSGYFKTMHSFLGRYSRLTLQPYPDFPWGAGAERGSGGRWHWHLLLNKKIPLALGKGLWRFGGIHISYIDSLFAANYALKSAREAERFGKVSQIFISSYFADGVGSPTSLQYVDAGTDI